MSADWPFGVTAPEKELLVQAVRAVLKDSPDGLDTPNLLIAVKKHLGTRYKWRPFAEHQYKIVEAACSHGNAIRFWALRQPAKVIDEETTPG